MGDVPATTSSEPPPRRTPVPGTAPRGSGAVARGPRPGSAGPGAGSQIRQSPAYGLGVDVDVDLRSALSAPRLPPELAGAAPARSEERATQEPGGALDSAPPPGSSWRPRQSLPVLARYGRFELLGRIARGGMAEILLARERSLAATARHVVVKRILPQAAEDADFVRMFLAEGRLVMGLTHPNVCHVYDVGQEGDTWFIAMEWVQGQPLSKVIRRARERGRALPAPLAARMMADVASALHHAHNAKDASGARIGLVHRDVSPHNLMVAYDGPVKLLDFGIAKVTNSDEHTTTGVVKGKFAYMAPEQCLGRRLDARADVFALGVCLYEALTGRTLYRRANDYDTMRAVIKEPVPSIRDVDPRLPEALDAIVKRALQKSADDRFESAQAMELALERYIAEERHLVNSALVGRLMRRLFAEEVRRGPALDPIAGPPTVDLVAAGPEPVQAAPEPSAVSSLASRPARPRSLLWTLAGAVIVAAAAIGLTVGWRPGLLRVEAEGTPAPSPGPEPVEPDEVRRPALVVSPGGALASGGSEPAQAVAPAEPLEEARPEDARADREAQRRDRRRRVAARAEQEAERGQASLSINTRPWSKVYLGRRLLGTTPIGAASVPAGRITLRFEDRDGRTHQRTLRLNADERAERFFDLTD